MKRPKVGDRIRILRPIDGCYLQGGATGEVRNLKDYASIYFGLVSFGDRSLFWVEYDNWEYAITPEWPPKESRPRRYSDLKPQEVPV